jgi:hypothetical protein
MNNFEKGVDICFSEKGFYQVDSLKLFYVELN